MGRYCFTSIIQDEHDLYSAYAAQDLVHETLILNGLEQGQYNPYFSILVAFEWQGDIYIGYSLDGSWYTCKEVNDHLAKSYNFKLIETLDHDWDYEVADKGAKIKEANYLKGPDDVLKLLKIKQESNLSRLSLSSVFREYLQKDQE